MKHQVGSGSRFKQRSDPEPGQVKTDIKPTSHDMENYMELEGKIIDYLKGQKYIVLKICIYVYYKGRIKYNDKVRLNTI